MPAKVIKYLIVLGLVGAAIIYVVVLNSSSVTVQFSSSSSVTAPLSVVLIAVFLLGALAAGVVTFLMSARFAWREWRRERRERKQQSHRELITAARQSLALEQTKEAEGLLSRVVSEDRNNVEGWVNLARTRKESEGQLRALQTLDEARRSNPNNIELLFEAANLQEQAGNYTAAYDCLSVVLQNYPGNIRTLRRMAELAAKLERYETALEHLEEVVRRVDDAKRPALRAKSANLELALVKKEGYASVSDFGEILKRHRDFAPAMNEIALLEKKSGKHQDAAAYWAKAYAATGDAVYLENLAQMWLSLHQPERAVSAIQNAVNRSSEEQQLNARIFLVNLYLFLEMVGEADAELKKIKQEQQLTEDSELHLSILQAQIAYKNGKLDEAYRHFHSSLMKSNLIPQFKDLQDPVLNGPSKARWQKQGMREAPSPQLSTP